ncbi:MAG: hypothetical protein QOH88_729 [Verrucomicrobiota bacterium]|jgi:hypothetical protein
MSLPVNPEENARPNEESPPVDTFDYLALEAFLRRFRPLAHVRYPLMLALLSTILTFAFGFCAYLVIQNKIPPEGWLGIWNRWDAWHYLNVAEHGYAGEGSGEQRYMIVFLPLYPLSIHLSYFLVRNWHVAAVIVSNLCAAGAFCYCFLLTQKEYGRHAAKAAVFYFSIFPTAYFLHVAYSESVFLFLTIGAFYYARQSRWLPCALMGMLATSSRISGLAVMLPLAFEYFQQKEFRWRNIRWDAALLALIPLGVVAYLYLNYHYFGDPFKFLQYQREHWHRWLRWPFPALKANWYMVTHDTAVIERVMQHGWQLAAFVFGTAGLILAAFRLRLCYTLYLALSWVLIFCDSFTLCSPRYLLTLFPLFMLMAEARRREWLHYSATMLFLLFYALNVTQFVRGWWAH